jgi:hypothetical protein
VCFEPRVIGVFVGLMALMNVAFVAEYFKFYKYFLGKGVFYIFFGFLCMNPADVRKRDDELCSRIFPIEPAL